MDIHVVDPPAYTPPYDRALCGALARAGADVTLHTAPFSYGAVPAAINFKVEESFGSMLRGTPGSAQRTATRLASEVPDMLRYRRSAQAADVVHFQWLALPQIDWALLPADRPLVITAHDVIPRAPRPGQVEGLRRAYARADAVVVHSEDGRERLQRELGVPPERISVIAHGAFTELTEIADRAPLPAELEGFDGPVVLCFGRMAPYKGLDLAIEAWRGIEGAQLWVVGLPTYDTAALKASAPDGVRFVERFVDDREIPALFERADLALLPYREIDHSGVCFTAMAFGTPMLLSDIGGFREIADAGAAELFSGSSVEALHTALLRLIDDREARDTLAVGARRAARERYDWDSIAALHLELYTRLSGRLRR
ncbi:MAG: glycosyltransferase [Actinobacteria bacterium]|uniref:Unannotated protein n=1 Tax=freshwater metagenome TaxID=449393 RepID=A0A6J5Z643_9ZZZZ|nr:glycosyltransferase [Actinomycetota bacterium]